MKNSYFSLYFLISIFISAISATSYAQTVNQHTKLDRPKLVVGIVVDQMRWDYLYRYFDRYNNEGFKRLLNEGFSAENTQIDYVPTYTAIGHSSLYTGSVPAIHGIAGNDFILEKNGQSVYCTEDNDVSTVGSETKAGYMSPKNLLSSTITDELKLATNFRSKVIGVAIKDRGSILPAGHMADAAYWYDGAVGKWISSTFYMKELPSWVNRLNDQKLVEKYLNQGWNTLYPIETYVQSTADNNEYEGKFKGTDAPVFPINTAQLYKESGPGIITSTPYGNTLTFDMAKAAIDNELLGQRGITDFLAMSLSSPDYIGHQFGPNSIEIEDTYLRLDQELGDFLKYLDKTIGKGEYTVFLSADHGGAHNVSFMQDHKMPAGAWGASTLSKTLNEHLEAIFGNDKLVISLMNYQVHFNNTEIKSKGLDLEKIKTATIAFLKDQEGIAFVVDMEKAQSASIPAVIRERIINGFHHGRSGTIQIIIEPGWYSNSAKRPTGTTHGSWNPFDAHIPLIFMGWGINPGKTSRLTHMTDLASTLAALLKIQEPNGNIGNPIIEVLKAEN